MLTAGGAHGVGQVDDEALKEMDKDTLIKAKKAQEEKLKREAEERMRQAVLKLDHLERARRENERDLLDKVYEQQKKQDKQRWEVESKQFLENHKKKHAEDVEGAPSCPFDSFEPVPSFPCNLKL